MSLRRWSVVRSTAILTLGVGFLVAAVGGCTASASFSAGGEANEPPPPPPPPQRPPEGKKEEASKPAASAAEAQPTGAPKPEEEKPPVVTKGDSILLPGNIVFDSGAATLTAGESNEAILEQLKAYLDKNAKVTLMRIEGHTDNVGKPADNLKLSGERALAIKNALVERGVAKERLLATGFGEAKPIADNSTEQGRALNRRTEFKIAGINGRNYLGNKPHGGGTEFK